jgi:hypothetical protein
MSGKIQLQRHVDLTSAVMIIVGAIVGSGIYISPKGTNTILNLMISFKSFLIN